MQPNIVIAGCGLSGMISAIAFAKRGIPVTLIEKRSVDSTNFFHDIRTTALTPSSKQLFQDIGIWESISKHCGNINHIYVVDNKAPEMIHFNSEILEGNEVMGYIIENTLFKKELFSIISSNNLIKLIDNTSYNIKENSNDKLVLYLDEKTELKADMLLLCDGASSLIKQRYFSNETEKMYDQYALTFITRHEKSHEATAVEHFMRGGPFAILPLKDEYLSSVVWTVRTEEKDSLLGLPRDEFLYLLQENFGEFLGKVNLETEIQAFPLKACNADKYFNKKIVLVADTAHTIHPLAGQGLNQGIKDISSLVFGIVRYGINEKTFKDYEKSRKADNNIMLEATDTLNILFSNNSSTLHTGRQIGFKLIEKIPTFKKLLIKYAMGKR